MSLLAERLTAQGLAGSPARDPRAVVERLLAVQAQDPRGGYLALRARSEGLSAAGIDREVAEDRTLLITWLNRGTLHLVRREDYPWLHALTAPRIESANARRLAQEGVSPDQAERAVTLIARVLGEEGPLARNDLRQRIRAAGVRVVGQAFVHLLMRASIRGVIIRVPALGGPEKIALVRDWLGDLPAIDRETSLAELARRYLAGHGPADEADLARWAGLPKRDVRHGLRAIAPELQARDDGLLNLKHHGPAAALPRPRLLGPFEPVLLGWTSRALLLGENEPQVISGGVFRAFALVDGRAAATWTISRGALRLDAFAELTGADHDALDADARSVTRFLGDSRTGQRG